MHLLQRLAYPAVLSLIAFLAYSSQVLFAYIEPRPLPKSDAYVFNALVACIFICYTRACFTPPGKIPRDWENLLSTSGESAGHAESNHASPDLAAQRQRWCRKCEARKPPRAHHCKTCGQCIMKMDHHCVWTGNCVSHSVLPHFVRFLFYAVVSMAYLEYFLSIRAAVLWEKRYMPSYLGPNIWQLAHLFVLVVVNSLVLFALVLLLGRTIWSMSLNTFTIEGWEIERHETLLRRARTLGGYLTSPEGKKIRLERQEFPWDIGIWANVCQSMGTSNPLAWPWPFARNPSLESGLAFEHNGIEDPNKPWPPPDPDRSFHSPRIPQPNEDPTAAVNIEDFRRRQEADLARYVDGELIVRRRPFHERYADAPPQNGSGVQKYKDYAEDTDDIYDSDPELVDSPNAKAGRDEGEEAWRNKEGERLADFGVDEEAEFYDEDDLPLSELMRRRKIAGGRE